MYESKNLCEPIKAVVDKWNKEGRDFYIGPENIFRYKNRDIEYKTSMEINSTKNSWYASNKEFKDIPELELWQIKDISNELIKYYKPNTIGLILDYRCNYKCKMCPFHGKGYKGEYWNNRQGLMRTVQKEEAFILIDKINNNGIKNIVLSSAGEIFSYPYWEDVAQYADSKNMKTTIITNGSMIDEEMCKRIKTVGIANVSVSIDALSEEVYIQVRNTSIENYKKAINAPILLKKYGFNVNIHFVIQEENKHELEEFKEYWKNQNIDSLSIGYEIQHTEKGYMYSKSEVSTGNKEEDIGICSKYGDFVILQNGVVTGCCEMQLLINDLDSFGIPNVNFLEEEYDNIINKVNDLIAKDEAPLRKHCSECALYTNLFVEKEHVGAWIVTKKRNHEVWIRNRFVVDEKKIIDKLNNYIDIWNEKNLRVMIYGAGDFTKNLFNNTKLKTTNIISITDTSYEKYNKEYLGYDIVAPSSIGLYKPDIVLVASKRYQDEIYEKLIDLVNDESMVVKLY